MEFKTMDNNQQTGHPIVDKFCAGVSLIAMIMGWITIDNVQGWLQLLATLISIAAGSMVFINNYKQSKRKP